MASLVVFENGRPLRAGYRNYRVRHAPPGDDFAALQEVVGRRYLRILEERGVLPDLILVDGGKGQISAAARALRHLQLDIPIAGLAKREETVYQLGRREAVPLGPESSARLLLERIRDEAHRVAVSHQRVRRRKQLRASDLDHIPGVGPGRRRRLLKHFGSLRSLAEADPEEVRSVPGIGPEIARRIGEHLQGAATDEASLSRAR